MRATTIPIYADYLLSHISNIPIFYETHDMRHKTPRIKLFFLGEKKTLLQDITSNIIGYVFNGIIITSVGLLILYNIEQQISLSERRSALKAIQNDSIHEFIKYTSENHQKLFCALDPDKTDIVDIDCSNLIDRTVSTISIKRLYLESIFPDENFLSVTQIEHALKTMQEIKSGTLKHNNSLELTKKYKQNYRIMIQELSKMFR